MTMDTWSVVLILGQFAFIGWIIWVAVKFNLEGKRRRSEERFRLLERFSTGQELLDFINSPAGERLFLAFSNPRPDSQKGALQALGAGLVVSLAGVGCMVLSVLRVWNDRETFLVPGVLGIAIGIGILISAWVSLRLSRKLPQDGDLKDVRRTLEA
jgi:hypothetical protein